MPSMPPPAPLLEPGYRLDRYELLCKIGQGGMATVWLARTENSHGEERLVAIKTIIAGMASDESLRAMLLDEARIVQNIDHPNVARTLEVGQLWDMPYLVLEYVEGESLDQLCKALHEIELPVPAAIVVRIVADAALGLHEAHEMVGPDGDSLGIVHRDISPPNILVDDHGLARIIDFGVAKAHERFTPETEIGVMKGRVPYMAPEHASGGTVDRRTDIWALGAVAYYMLAGRYPFDGPNDAARLIRILGTDGPDPLPESVTPAVRDVVFRALSKDPDDRFATAAELAAALEVSKMPATHKEVAQFFAETLTRSIESRRSLVEHALAAADARARARQLLDGPMAGSTSYRPPAVGTKRPSSDRPPAVPLGGGTLDTVTKSAQPTSRQWVPWATAVVIALIVVIAFALGSMTARPQRSVATTAGPPPPGGESGAVAAATPEQAKAEAEAKARAEADAKANASADANAKAEADREAAVAKAAAEAKLAAEAADAKAGDVKAADAKAARAKANAAKYTWPPPPPTTKPPATKVTPTTTTTATATATSKKPPEREDTIY